MSKFISWIAREHVPKCPILREKRIFKLEVLITIWNSLRRSPENNSDYTGGILQDTPLPEAQLNQRVVQWTQKKLSYLPSLNPAEKKNFSSTLTRRNCRPPRVFWARAVWPEKKDILPKPENPKTIHQRNQRISDHKNILTPCSQDLMLVEYLRLRRKKVWNYFPLFNPNWKFW